MQEWYCIATEGRRERIAVDALRSEGFEALAPRRREERELKGFPGERVKTRQVTVQLFPGYVLAQSDLFRLQVLLAHWRQTRRLSAIGIYKFVTLRGRPAAIEAGFVDALKEHLDEDEFFIEPCQYSMTSTYDPIESGTEVVIMEGPYAGVFASFSHMKGSERSMVLMKAFGGRDTLTEFPRGSIRRASELEVEQ